MKLYCFKLSSGEEVIAKANIGNDCFLENSVELHNAITFVPTNQGIGAVPWPNTGNNEIVNLNIQQCVAMTEARKEVEQIYIKSTSGIDIPTTSNLIM